MITDLTRGELFGIREVARDASGRSVFCSMGENGNAQIAYSNDAIIPEPSSRDNVGGTARAKDPSTYSAV